MVRVLEQIPGPLFLEYFLFYALFLLLLAWFLNLADGSWSRTPPSLNHFNVDALAYLEGGSMGVVRTSIYRLWQQGLLGSDKPAGVTLAKPREGIDQEVLDALQGVFPSQQADLLLVQKRLQPHIDQLVNNLEKMGLVHKKARQRYRTRMFIFSVLLWSMGGTRFLLGLANHRPGFFLFLMLVVSQILLVLILRQGRVLTTQGRRFMAATRNEFSWMKSLDKNSITDPGVDSALGVALFGSAFLLALPGAAGVFGLFQPGIANAVSGSDGFGGSDFGGGDGGGSDGGDGGGGCGGCGGGGD